MGGAGQDRLPEALGVLNVVIGGKEDQSAAGIEVTDKVRGDRRWRADETWPRRAERHGTHAAGFARGDTASPRKTRMA